jgi:hypothetical protein
LRNEGYPVEEKNLTFKDLYTADEMFVCGTGAEIKPIVEVDGRVIGDGEMGPVVEKAIENISTKKECLSINFHIFFWRCARANHMRVVLGYETMF